MRPSRRGRSRRRVLLPVPPRGLPPGRVVNLPGRGEVFVREGGDGPTIALLHGWTASADLNWWRVYPSLLPVGRIVAIDHRGHGRGMRSEHPFTLEDAADDVAATLRALGAAPAVLVGYSMGGPVSLLTWLRHRDVVRGLVLQATALEWRASARERVVWKSMAALEYVFRLGRPRGVLDYALGKMVRQSPDLAPLLGWLKAELRRGDPEALADAGRALGNYDFRPHAGAVDVPAAVVVTTRDRLVRPEKQRELAHSMPGARAYELDGDHDAPLVLAAAFPAVTVAAVRAVLGYDAPARRTAG